MVVPKADEVRANRSVPSLCFLAPRVVGKTMVLNVHEYKQASTEGGNSCRLRRHGELNNNVKTCLQYELKTLSC